MSTVIRASVAEPAMDLTPEVRAATRDLILALADSKRLLGTRYADWLLGAPELEAGIACASMAQDEWGHSRLLYALLKDFDEDVDALEHGRAPEQYASIETLDDSPKDWPALVALNALVDTALTVQLEALRDSSYAPLKQRVAKLIDEEQFHFAHAQAWVKRLAGGGDEPREAIATALENAFGVMRWFGDNAHAAALQAAGIMDADADTLRQRFMERIMPLLTAAKVVGENEAIGFDLDFSDFDAARRRTTGTAPDAETIRRVRGDRNRAFLMD